MQGRCEQLEKEMEWVKSERDEAQKVAEASAARVKELEAAASRQKGHRKDDSKKTAKESKAAIHRAEVRTSALNDSVLCRWSGCMHCCCWSPGLSAQP